MPATLSARAFLWIGVSLLAAAVIVQAVLDFVYRNIASDALQDLVNTSWFAGLDITRAVLVPLGPLMFAAFFVARAIERRSVSPASPRPRLTAGWVFGAGVVLTLVGVLVNGALEGWLMDLNARGRTSLALDALNLVVVPLRTLLFPLGLALLPASALMKKLEAESSPDPSRAPTTP
jgi:hypothetical protein